MLIAALVIVVLFALLPASAAADGLPAVGVDANPVSNPGGQVEYQTEKSGRSTRVVESARYGGVLQERLVRGVYSVPAVAMLIPLTAGMDAMRQVVFGAEGFLDVWTEVGLLAGLGAVFLLLARRTLAMMERKAREEGALTVKWQ